MLLTQVIIWLPIYPVTSLDLQTNIFIIKLIQREPSLYGMRFGCAVSHNFVKVIMISHSLQTPQNTKSPEIVKYNPKG